MEIESVPFMLEVAPGELEARFAKPTMQSVMSDLEAGEVAVSALKQVGEELLRARANSFKGFSQDEAEDLAMRAYSAIEEVQRTFALSLLTPSVVSPDSNIRDLMRKMYEYADLSRLGSSFHSLIAEEVVLIREASKEARSGAEARVAEFVCKQAPVEGSAAEAIKTALRREIDSDSFLKRMDALSNNDSFLDTDSIFTGLAPLAGIFSSRMLRHHINDLEKAEVNSSLIKEVERVSAGLKEQRAELRRYASILSVLGYNQNQSSHGLSATKQINVSLSETLGAPHGVDMATWLTDLKSLNETSTKIREHGALEIEPGVLAFKEEPKAEFQTDLQQHKEIQGKILKSLFDAIEHHGFLSQDRIGLISERELVKQKVIEALRPLFQSKREDLLGKTIDAMRVGEILLPTVSVITPIQCALLSLPNLASAADDKTHAIRSKAAQFGLVDPDDNEKDSRFVASQGYTGPENLEDAYGVLRDLFKEREVLFSAVKFAPIAERYLKAATLEAETRLGIKLPTEFDPILWQGIRDAVTYLGEVEPFERFSSELKGENAFQPKDGEWGKNLISPSLILHLKVHITKKSDGDREYSIRTPMLALLDADPDLEKILPACHVQNLRASGQKIALDSDDIISVGIPIQEPVDQDAMSKFIVEYKRYLESALTKILPKDHRADVITNQYIYKISEGEDSAESPQA